MTIARLGLLIFVCVLGAVFFGMLLSSVPPVNNLSADSKEIVKTAVGLVATMTALLLGLLVASAKGSHDAQQNRVIQIAARIAFLDRALANCGPEATETRGQLRDDLAMMIDRIWPVDKSVSTRLDPFSSQGDMLYESIQNLSPQNEAQHAAKSLALKTAFEIGQLYSEMFAQVGTAIPKPLLIVVVSWLVFIFMSFGLFAPPNATVIIALTAAALSVSTALIMVLDLDRAFDGLIGVSDEPMRGVLRHLGR